MVGYIISWGYQNWSSISNKNWITIIHIVTSTIMIRYNIGTWHIIALYCITIYTSYTCVNQRLKHYVTRLSIRPNVRWPTYEDTRARHFVQVSDAGVLHAVEWYQLSRLPSIFLTKVRKHLIGYLLQNLKIPKKSFFVCFTCICSLLITKNKKNTPF